jgi:hypothetical protein
MPRKVIILGDGTNLEALPPIEETIKAVSDWDSVRLQRVTGDEGEQERASEDQEGSFS